MTHIKETNKMMKESENNDNSVVSEYTEIFEAEALSQEEIENAENTHSSLVEALDITPPWQVKRKGIADLTNNSMRTIKSNYKKAKLALTNKFTERVAPGKSSVLADMLFDDDDAMLDETINENLKTMKDIYKSSNNFGQLVILSLASQQYSKFIMNYFECSKRKVDNARKLYSLTEGISIPENKKHKRSKLDLRKCDHFLYFIFDNGLIQDVAYGTTNLTYSSGDTQTIPHAVITARYKHIIAYYLQFCKDNNYESLSESSLYRILKELKPSQ